MDVAGDYEQNGTRFTCSTPPKCLPTRLCICKRGKARRATATDGHPPRWQVRSRQKPRTVYSLGRRTTTVWQRVQVPHIERGRQEADFAVLPVWTITQEGAVRAEWSVLSRDPDGRLIYSLLNGPSGTPARVLIERSCWRFFIEPMYEDAKSEMG